MKQYVIMAASIVSIVFVVSLSFSTVTIHEDRMKANNIDAAISRGIDPLAVRCAYTSSYSSKNDTICVEYASRRKSVDAPILNSAAIQSTKQQNSEPQKKK